MMINDVSHAGPVTRLVGKNLNHPGADHSSKGLLYFRVAVIEEQVSPSAHTIIKLSLSSTANLIRKK